MYARCFSDGCILWRVMSDLYYDYIIVYRRRQVPIPSNLSTPLKQGTSPQSIRSPQASQCPRRSEHRAISSVGSYLRAFKAQRPLVAPRPAYGHLGTLCTALMAERPHTANLAIGAELPPLLHPIGIAGTTKPRGIVGLLIRSASITSRFDLLSFHEHMTL